MQVSKLVKTVVLLGAVATQSLWAAQVSTDGSTSMEKVMGVLSESFKQANPGISVTYNPTGSGAGITAVSEGRADIGLSSRQLKDAEAKTLDGKVVALDGIVMVVNKKNTVNDLTVEQIGKIYRGEITNWKDVGGADKPIVLIGREAGSGTRDGFESVTKTHGKAQYRQELTSTGDVLTTVSTNVNAIGYASLSALNKKVKALQVGGVTPTEETVQKGTYPLQRPFLMVVKREGTLSPEAKKFLDYALSSQADDLKRKAGVVPTVAK